MVKQTKTITCSDLDGKQYEVPTSELTFRPSVQGIVVRDGKVLLARQPNRPSYDLSGGGMDLGEMIETTLIREVKERRESRLGRCDCWQ